MSQILGLKFADYGQIYFFSSGPFVVHEGQHVLVKTDQGMGMGEVVLIRQAMLDDEGAETEERKPIYRLANDQDLETVAENRKLASEAFSFCRQCIRNHDLGMKLVDVEVFFDRTKMVFYFTAPGRIDFRELIKDLVREYRTRIELRQIGVRHETQMLGAIGNCGQLCCCRRFMRKFNPVTIKMAKEQNLFLNPTKISGICGRLLCCLAFEQEGYEQFNRMCPKVGKRYRTSMGMAKVLRTNFFNKSLTVLLEDGGEHELPVDEWAEVVGKSPAPGDESQQAKARVVRPPEDKEPSQAKGDDDQAEPDGPADDANKRPAQRKRPRKDLKAPKGQGRQNKPPQRRRPRRPRKKSGSSDS